MELPINLFATNYHCALQYEMARYIFRNRHVLLIYSNWYNPNPPTALSNRTVETVRTTSGQLTEALIKTFPVPR